MKAGKITQVFPLAGKSRLDFPALGNVGTYLPVIIKKLEHCFEYRVI